jgi:creatinine amidohydrolase/Fe(II)-dependent formamide hydrolase-like protein
VIRVLGYAYKTAYTYNPEAIHIIPVGSLEQHDNLPLGTDTFIAECLSWHVRDRLAGKGLEALVLPPLFYGFSPEWMGYPGTISLGLDVFCGVIISIIESLVSQSVRRIVFMNGHGGNSNALRSCIQNYVHRLPDQAVIGVIDYYRYLRVKLGHACKVERSILDYCGIETPSEPGNTIVKTPVSWVFAGGKERRPTAVVPPGDKALVKSEIEELINSITSDIILLVEKGKELSFP